MGKWGHNGTERYPGLSGVDGHQQYNLDVFFFFITTLLRCHPGVFFWGQLFWEPPKSQLKNEKYGWYLLVTVTWAP